MNPTDRSTFNYTPMMVLGYVILAAFDTYYLWTLVNVWADPTDTHDMHDMALVGALIAGFTGLLDYSAWLAGFSGWRPVMAGVAVVLFMIRFYVA